MNKEERQEERRRRYRRTTGGKHSWKRFGYRPQIVPGKRELPDGTVERVQVALMLGGSTYIVRDDGWRRIRGVTRGVTVSGAKRSLAAGNRVDMTLAAGVPA